MNLRYKSKKLRKKNRYRIVILIFVNVRKVHDEINSFLLLNEYVCWIANGIYPKILNTHCFLFFFLANARWKQGEKTLSMASGMVWVFVLCIRIEYAYIGYVYYVCVSVSPHDKMTNDPIFLFARDSIKWCGWIKGPGCLHLPFQNWIFERIILDI